MLLLGPARAKCGHTRGLLGGKGRLVYKRYRALNPEHQHADTTLDSTMHIVHNAHRHAPSTRERRVHLCDQTLVLSLRNKHLCFLWKYWFAIATTAYLAGARATLRCQSARCFASWRLIRNSRRHECQRCWTGGVRTTAHLLLSIDPSHAGLWASDSPSVI